MRVASSQPFFHQFSTGADLTSDRDFSRTPGAALLLDDDHVAVGVLLHLVLDAHPEGAAEEALVVAADDDQARAAVLGQVDDLPARIPGRPDVLRLDPGRRR